MFYNKKILFPLKLRQFSSLFFLAIFLKSQQEKIKAENCVEINDADGSCLKCEDSYYLDKNKRCVISELREAQDNTKVDCNIKNCMTCGSKNECNKCFEGYYLTEQRCYSTNCGVFGFCKYCDEYDCLKCLNGYKLTYGICDEKINALQKKLFLGIGIPLLTIGFFVFLLNYLKKRTRNIIESGKILNFRHPKAGNYIISLPDSKDELNETEAIKSVNKSLELYSTEEKGELNECVVCYKKKVFSFADCGCALCFEHWKNVRNDPERYTCRIHNVPLTKFITFHLNNKSTIKGNAVDKLCLDVCPVCKVAPGTMDFGCECKLKLCQKCFNDNVYILKYNQCPGCGEPYNPSSKKGKNRKESDKGKNKDKIDRSSRASSRKGSVSNES